MEMVFETCTLLESHSNLDFSVVVVVFTVVIDSTDVDLMTLKEFFFWGETLFTSLRFMI